MDLSGLSSVTTKSEMLTWLAANFATPVTPAISASDLGTILQKLLDVSGDGSSGTLFDTKTANYTLASADKAIALDSPSAKSITVPANASVAFPVGTEIQLQQSGSGQLTVTPASGVTINAADGHKSLRTQFSGARLLKTGTDTWWLSGDLAETPVPVIKTAQINMTNSGGDATSSGWNNLYFSDLGNPKSLNSPQGASLGWSITAAATGTAVFEHLPGATFGNTDFPDDILQWLWYLDHGTSFSFTVSGLNSSKTYTVKTCSADNGSGDGITNVNVGGTSQTADPNGAAAELTFTGVVSDEFGSLSILVDNTAGAPYPLINAMIIAEN